MSPVELADFTSYDLGRLLEELEAELAVRPDNYAATALWIATQNVLPWDQRQRRCWDDPAFTARYRWLRARLIPADAKSDYPLRSVVTELSRVLVELMALEQDRAF